MVVDRQKIVSFVIKLILVTSLDIFINIKIFSIQFFGNQSINLVHISCLHNTNTLNYKLCPEPTKTET